MKHFYLNLALKITWLSYIHVRSTCRTKLSSQRYCAKQPTKRKHVLYFDFCRSPLLDTSSRKKVIQYRIMQQISPANILVTLLPAKPQNQESCLNVASPLCCGLFMLILGFTLGCVLTAV